jgi:hypothetical protein
MAQHLFSRTGDLAAVRSTDSVAPEPDRMTHRSRPIIDVGEESEQSVALTEYLHAVSEHLRRRELFTDAVCVFSPTPHRALSATMTLRSSRTGVMISAGWHEELGWWVSGRAGAGSGPAWSGQCWLGELLPTASRAAELLDSAVREGVGRDAPPRVLRYRRAAGRFSVAEMLRAAG